MKLSVVYDNEAEDGFRSSWGFSIHIGGSNENILFDTGKTGDILTFNMEKLGIEPDEIDKVALSHEHGDHIGGLVEIIDGDEEVFIPKSFSNDFKRDIGSRVDVTEVVDKGRISDKIFTTGEMGGGIKEQSLVLESDRGYILLTGCAHPGLTDIIQTVRSEFGELYGVIGGFHGFKEFSSLKEIEMIYPCHCTKYKETIIKRYPDRSHACAVGCEIEL